jgi:lysyl-tRNA synthetase class 2
MTSPTVWQPIANIDMLRARASLYRVIRDFFEEREVLEVDTPILSQSGTVDPFIESLFTEVCRKKYFLQTSPEFFLKRLLANNSGDIYSLGKVFRQGEQGKKHSPEFTLLEWYRVNWSEHRLMDEVEAFLKNLMPDVAINKTSYQDLFLSHFNIDPHSIFLKDLKLLVKKNIDINFELFDISACFDLLMTHCIEPKMPKGLFFIYDYPADQAALASLGKNKKNQIVARRFEAYLNGTELANGYYELRDASEQKKRFEKDVNYRRQNNLPSVPYDKQLVAALASGMPECAGVALGIDRLLMELHKKSTINEVLSFSI